MTTWLNSHRQAAPAEAGAASRDAAHCPAPVRAQAQAAPPAGAARGEQLAHQPEELLHHRVLAQVVHAALGELAAHGAVAVARREQQRRVDAADKLDGGVDVDGVRHVLQRKRARMVARC